MPLITHRGHAPHVHPDAYIAPTAVLCGDVYIGAGARVLFGAVITAEDGHVRIGRRCVVMENSLVRGRGAHPAEVGDDVLIGPHAHVNGATIGDGCFLATGCSLFPGARLEHIADAAHVPSMECPGEFDRIVLGFLAEQL